MGWIKSILTGWRVGWTPLTRMSNKNVQSHFIIYWLLQQATHLLSYAKMVAQYVYTGSLMTLPELLTHFKEYSFCQPNKAPNIIIKCQNINHISACKQTYIYVLGEWGAHTFMRLRNMNCWGLWCPIARNANCNGLFFQWGKQLVWLMFVKWDLFIYF